MKKVIILAVCYFLLLLSLPLLFSRGGTPRSPDDGRASDGWGDSIKVLNTQTGKVMLLDSLTYITGVVAAEMPATYGEEALKAQAVAAYTYAMRKKEYADSHPDYAEETHNGAAVCTDYAHCKSYRNTQQQMESWGNNYEKYSEKIKTCVQSVYGEMLLYDGQPALTVFHSMSAGRTAACADVWGNDVPYLVSVKSDYDENDKNYETKVSFTDAQVKEILSEYSLPSSPDEWMEITERAESGYVKSVLIGGEASVSGGDMRKLFSLRSNAFEIERTDGGFTFTVHGYGHGVGMSQVGAGGMAASGSSYKEILEWYYPGTYLADEYAPDEA